MPKNLANISPPQPLLAVEGLSCHFNRVAVVEALSFTLNRGEVLGLVGLNGAGKSTALRMLCGLLEPSAGDVRIDGFSLSDQPEQARHLLGYLPDPPALHDCLSVSEAIDINARLHGLNPAQRRNAMERVLTQCQLEGVKGKRIKALSKGFRQRTGLALSLVHSPSVLVLDEPASGLDPAQTQHLNGVIKSLATDCAIVFSSHSIADVQQCCTRVALLHSGRFIQDDSGASAHDSFNFKLVLREAIEAESLLSLPAVLKLQAIDPCTWQLQLQDNNPESLAAAVIQHGWGLRELSPLLDTISATLQQLHAGASALEAA